MKKLLRDMVGWEDRHFEIKQLLDTQKEMDEPPAADQGKGPLPESIAVVGSTQGEERDAEEMQVSSVSSEEMQEQSSVGCRLPGWRGLAQQG